MNPSMDSNCKTSRHLKLLNTVQFYCDVMCRSGPNVKHKLSSLRAYGSQGPSNIIKFGKDADVGLKEFLKRFFQLFFILGDEVILKNWILFHLNQKHWLKELLPQHCLSSPNVEILVETIQFYCNIIFTRCHKTGMNFHTLFEHKTNEASFDVQAVANSKNELYNFLFLHSSIFRVEGEIVYLTDSAMSYRNMASWINRLLKKSAMNRKSDIESDLVFDDRFNALSKNSSDLNDALGFYYYIVLTNRSKYDMVISQLFSLGKASAILRKRFSDDQEVKVFLSSFPQIFTLTHDKVCLTRLPFSLNRPTTNKNSGNSNYSSEATPISENPEQLAVDFFSDILARLSVEHKVVVEIPIDHLFCYAVDAPSIVNKFINTPDKLRNVLIKYPTIFSCNNGKVSVCHSNVSNPSNVLQPSSINTVYSVNKLSITGNVAKKTIRFYSDLITEFGGIININQLLDWKSQPGKIYPKIPRISLEELKQFLQAHADVFVIKNDMVFLNSDLVNQDATSYKAPLINDTEKIKHDAITFYSSFMKKQSRKLIPINVLIGHRSCASPDVKKIAKNPIELKAFLSQFPEKFTIIKNNVMLNQGENHSDQVQGSSSEYNLGGNTESQKNAVEYFSKMLNHYGIGRSMHINSLFEYKLKSSSVIQTASGSNIDQFKTFLMQHPDHFIVTNENVIGKKIIPDWSYGGKYENQKFIDPLLMLIFNFFFEYTKNKSLFHVDHLYDNSGKYFVYSNYSPVFQNKSELLLFLALYPHIFYVDCFRVINLIASSWKARVIPLDSKFDNKRSGEKSCSISEKLKELRIAAAAKELKTAAADCGFVDSSNSNIPISDALLDLPMEDKYTNSSGKSRKKPNYFIPRGKIIKKKARRNKLIISSAMSDEPFDFDSVNNSDEESLERDILVSSSDIWENTQVFWEDQLSTYSNNVRDGAFKPMKFEEIENHVFAQFKTKLLGGFQFSKKEQKHENPNAFSGTVFINQRLNEVSDISGSERFFQIDNNNLMTMEALAFLNFKLWEHGRLQILKIPELFNSFLLSGLEIIKYYCRNLDEFKNFISKHPLDFIVSRDNIMARKNQFDRIHNKYNEIESLALILFNFFNMYTRHNNFTHLKMIYSKVGPYFVYKDQTKIFRYPHELCVFLQMFPSVFYIENNTVINMTAPRKKSDDKIEADRSWPKIEFPPSEQYSDIIPESTNGWKISVLQKTHLIEDTDTCRSVVEHYLKGQEVIAVDCEGINLGIFGVLTLIQIGLHNGQVFIFDVYVDKDMIDKGGLRDVLESNSIVKVIHDSRNDYANLYTEYNVKINKIFDTRVAHHLIVNSGVFNVHMNKKRRLIYNPIAIGFNELCTEYGAPLNIQKDEMRHVYRTNYMFWSERPLTEDMLAYAALDVASLIQIYHTMVGKMDENSCKLVWEISLKYSMCCLVSKELTFD